MAMMRWALGLESLGRIRVAFFRGQHREQAGVAVLCRLRGVSIVAGHRKIRRPGFLGAGLRLLRHRKAFARGKLGMQSASE